MSLLAPKTKETRLNEWLLAMTAVPPRILEVTFNLWQQGCRMLWGPDTEITPAEKLEKLGPLAGELFAGSTSLAGWLLVNLGALNPATGELTAPENWKNSDMVNRILSVRNAIPDTTVHEDGTVTINQ